VLANDSDVEGSALTAKLVNPAAHGKVTLQSDGSYHYAPAKDYTGGDTFTYVANDGSDDSQAATVSIVVNPLNDPPIVAGDSVTTAEDTTGSGNVLANDSDVEGSALTAKLVNPAAHGKVTLQSDGSYHYAPAKDYNGSDTFTYVANDGDLDSQAATVAVTVTPVNDAPVLGAASFNLREDANVSTLVGTLSATDADVGDQLTYTIVTDGANGLFALDANTGALSVAAIPADKFRVGQTYNLTVQVTDSTGLSVQAPVVIAIVMAEKIADLKVLVIATGTVAEDPALKLMDDLLRKRRLIHFHAILIT
jgi:VCBS repeat-containing protein